VSDRPPDEPQGDDFDGFEDPDEFSDLPLDEHESQLVEQDLTDLADFEAAFRPEGYRGVAVWCQDCAEEHYYPWDMLRENLTLLLDTGETPVHEPAFAPEPSRYVPWDYARGYVDALRDSGVGDRIAVDACTQCGLTLPEEFRSANFCPRCGVALVRERLRAALDKAGLGEDAISEVMRATGFATR
jgi:hypothetical protein